jgi:hypothetical protein
VITAIDQKGDSSDVFILHQEEHAVGGLFHAADALGRRPCRRGGQILWWRPIGATGENPAYGDINNPWSLYRVPGVSLDGAAAATAADMCRIAIGSDTGGSVRIPAALCGVSQVRIASAEIIAERKGTRCSLIDCKRAFYPGFPFSR